MSDQPRGWSLTNLNGLAGGSDQIEAGELRDWLQHIDPDPTKHHFVEVAQFPAPGHGSQIVNLVAVCTCGWRSGEHQLYLGASTTWAEERARHQLEDAGIAHIRSLAPPA